MNKITRKKAISRTIEMWEELAKTAGDNKYNTKTYKKYKSLCSLCDYADVREINCDECLLVQNGFPVCTTSLYDKWACANTPQKRKKYAKRFLEEQLKKLK